MPLAFSLTYRRAFTLRVMLVVTALTFVASAAAQQRPANLHEAAEQTVAYNAELQRLMESYVSATEDKALVDATLALVEAGGDRERAIGAAQRELARLAERVAAVDAAYAALPDPPALYLPKAKANLPHVRAYLDYLSAGANQLRDNLRAQIGAVMRGDLNAARQLMREDVDQIITELGAENTLLRFQEAALSSNNPYRGVLSAIVAGNEVARAYLTLVNGVDVAEGQMQRLMGEISLWLLRQRQQVDENTEQIEAFCRRTAGMPDGMRAAFEAFCVALASANAIERDIGDVLGLNQQVAADRVRRQSVPGDPRIEEAEERLTDLVAARMNNQLVIREKAAALAGFVAR